MKFKNLEHMLTTARVFGHCFDPDSVEECMGVPSIVHCTRCGRCLCLRCANDKKDRSLEAMFVKAAQTPCTGEET